MAQGTVPAPYVEFPVDLIVDIHWKKKDDGGGGGGGPPHLGPPLCNSYSYGVIMANTGLLITSLPLSFAVAPFVGTWKTEGMNGPPQAPWGFLQGSPSLGLPSEIAAPPTGSFATGILLTPSVMRFTNAQIFSLPDYFGNIGTLSWEVPMAGGNAGTDAAPILLRAESYTITGSFAIRSLDDSIYGIAATYPSGPPGVPIPVIPPTVPDLVIGSQEASFSFTVDVPYPSPAALIWWMIMRRGTAWSATTDFMSTVLVGEGDTYQWEISANCAPVPSP